MRYLVLIGAAFCVVSSARAGDAPKGFVPPVAWEERLQSVEKDRDDLKQRVSDLERNKAQGEVAALEKKIAELEQQLTATKASPKTGKPAVTRSSSTTTTYRYPVGHTHTCDNCGDVFDHLKNPTHRCQGCGSTQVRQDPVPKMVPVVTAAESTTLTEPAPEPVPSATSSYFRLSTTSVEASGCYTDANGRSVCPTGRGAVQQQRPGLFGGRFRNR